MKKIISLILALVMICALATTAFAADNTNPGSITIDGFLSENVYKIYKMLDLIGYNKADEAYTYEVNSDWTNFFSDYATAPAKDGLDYVQIDTFGYVSWKADTNSSTYAEFAELAVKYAKENSIPAVAQSDATFTGKFENLELGYYLIDSTMGALCGLTTTNPHASIEAKNAAPSLKKQVQEDDNGLWNDVSATAGVGDTVNFRVIVEVHAGAQNYEFHDQMGEGLAFEAITAIEHLPNGSSVTESVSETNYTLITPTTTPSLEHTACDFEIQFNDDFCRNHLANNDELYIYYTAKVTDAAVGGIKNENTAWLNFGDGNDHQTPEDTAEVYTYAFDLIKLDGNGDLLDGATFKLYNALTEGQEIPVKAVTVDGKTHYMIDSSKALGAAGDAILVTDGYVRVEGLDNGTYYLEEITPPAGYTKPAARISFTISSSNLNANFTDADEYSSGGVAVVNQKGNKLPETGGMGTVMFVSFGMVVVLATGLLLVTKKRLSMIED